MINKGKDNKNLNIYLVGNKIGLERKIPKDNSR